MEHDVLDAFEHIGRDVAVKDRRSRIDDAHVHACTDGMVEEHGMHGLTDIIIAPEGK